MQALSLLVVGADFPNDRGPTRRFEIGVCAPGDPVHLAPEPKNKFDPNAIKVMSERGVQMGYLTAERAPLIGGWINAGRAIEAAFQEKTSWGAVIRLALDGSTLALPPRSGPPKSMPAAQTENDSGFYHDWIPPDD